MTPALFLDRDGVVNVDIGYLHRPSDCRFVPGIFELVRAANREGYRVFVVTNQAGIARGFYTEQVFRAFTEWMLDEFAQQDALIDKVYFCPHHPDAGLGEYRVACECRKPLPGMLLRARDEFDVDMARSIMIGDNLTDVEAALAAGVGRVFWLVDQTKETPSSADGYVIVRSFDDVRSVLTAAG
ncbi:TPA: D-glycero-beta-D-manno-heptose 1,7-bisphosphate 7-phosphatase [Burkholderia multivorans]|uniref:D-glycero-beta-D-manno-heptose 1,7-bisphosphate 7-phosphatase n=1 Tax=Burkholderia multivorans TaxID=87883 RepID=UPI000D003008|nr:D-glycero-beta-D-manno-heptose 1,7-bisphosphate 7-phosphatase [Burkholderia multivorans]MBU9301186.1 D-glycero-beta-D-manno-heptose 1,7-bisphosphate 7-phosphatase [Burkholderia multivorans]MBU9305662.1 D-glycero-beta-D-manno-heptose 1,7-bisphosphate 7-phosphatase [Burkholderia multivorans]MBU9408188.1 D-glycero-beta-D-manno-heptose 1,7-bisphosphate 7-phosphatase [Burkholderia multivorans]MBU9510413.1 D-glycero-beta-D-manno-heptose 1,7-bisphosphate 7-phosphatase [Burkholderia multivorans]MCA